jgi:hypothetical protein
MNTNSLAFVKYGAKKYIPSFIWRNAAKILQNKRSSDFAERHSVKDFGISEPKILVIRRRPPGGGLFSNMNHVLQGIEYAKSENLTPVVDMKNYWTSYSQRGKFNGSNNSWEYFFEPISDIHLEDLDKYQNLTFSKGDRILPSSPLADRGLNFVLNEGLLLKYSNLYAEYIKLNKQTREFMTRVKEFLEWETSSFGVSFRGSDYISMQPKGHARQPSYSQLLLRLENKFKKHNYSRLFIATEDVEARKMISGAYPDITYKGFRQRETIEKLLSDRRMHSNQTIEALGYLAEIYLLSECLSITCSIANGSASAFLINGGKYLEPDVINLGVY